MNKNYYDILWVSKNATEAEIKKAYKKMAMQYHPDRNKGDVNAEAKFKEVNEAYQVLGDPEKKKKYDQFWSADFSGFGGGSAGGNPFWGGQYTYSSNAQGFDFSDIFSGFGGGAKSSGSTGWFDFSDLFSSFGGGQGGMNHRQNTQNQTKAQSKPENLDVTETREIPFLDFLVDNTLPITTVYGEHLTLKVKAGTQPGTKFKITGKWRKSNGKTGNMYVIVNAKMPKNIPEHVQKMIDAIRYEI